MNSKYLYTFLCFFLCLQLLIAQPNKKPASYIKSATSTMPAGDSTKTDSLLVGLLRQYPEFFNIVNKNKKKLNVQIIFTQIDRDKNGVPNLTNYYFNADEKRYFYPASTVKLPVCMLALQRLNELKIKGLNLNSTIITGQGTSDQTAVFNDPTTFDGKPTIANYIKKILMVSDNDAYNRLFEFLGRKYINDVLHKLGYKEVQLLHRLQIPLSAEQNSKTNPVTFYDYYNNILYKQPLQIDSTKYLLRNDSIGECYYSGDSVVEHPMDFSKKNRISLQSLHSILISLVFPKQVVDAKKINLTDIDRNFVLKYMSQWPTESVFPPYSADSAIFYPAYGKFLLLGSEKGTAPKNIRIFNKIGEAYGQLTDVAYIVDFDKKVEFFLSATIYCNGDDILNKDKYDYEAIGLPFLKHLGEIMYEYNLKRPKTFLPDLSNFKFNYDGK